MLEIQKMRRMERARCHPEWSESIRSKVLRGEVGIGMTKSQVKASWGEPDDINRTAGSWGVNEQWVYDRGNFNVQYIYFKNNVVTSWQD
ncbi:DUF2845 domain-containing protein [Patescibacteria group bacterium]|nr:DUF2845 domain-containing protein [Patescibacteria group bacterium]